VLSKESAVNINSNMDETVGRKLSKARLQRGLSLDEAAHATKLRPDKIVALENDDYTSFASNVYARGFLQIYSRFLGVDVSEFASTLEGQGAFSIEDYQYLNSDAPARREERVTATPRTESRGPGIGSIVVFVLLLGGLGAGYNFYLNWQRIAPDQAAHNLATPMPDQARIATGTSPPPMAGNRPTILHPPGLRPAAQPPELRLGATPTVTDRDFVAPATAANAPIPNGPNEVLVQPIRKTWIIVRKDDPSSPPIFEDFLYPDSPALRLKGTRFFIEARDPTAIQIRKNGAPMAYQAPGVAVH
jgi:transcriptional regulator with XRE-family HTH domain